MRHVTLLCGALIMMCSSCGGPSEEAGVERQELGSTPGVTELTDLDTLPFGPAMVFVEAAWGPEHGSVSREEEAARTGPMAIAAEPDGGLAVLDTVGGRVMRYDGQGRMVAAIPIGVETADDVVVLPDRSVAVLAYRHEPEPGYDVLSLASDGTIRARRPSPQVATMPTALLLDGSSLVVENRHAAAHPTDGSPRLWGRPAGELLLRTQRLDGGLVVVAARDRSGQLAWERSIELPWTVVEILDLLSCDRYVAVVVRGIEASLHETTLIAFDRQGAPLGAHRLRDQRVTDASRPFALSRSGDLFELVTTEAGATVLRYGFEEVAP